VQVRVWAAGGVPVPMNPTVAVCPAPRFAFHASGVIFPAASFPPHRLEVVSPAGAVTTQPWTPPEPPVTVMVPCYPPCHDPAVA
jgi:hypothetical protein